MRRGLLIIAAVVAAGLISGADVVWHGGGALAQPKPPPAKPEAKPPPAKPTPKPPAAKPAVKPAAEPAAKPATKPPAAKPAPKPVAKPAKKLPAAKPTPKPAAAKPVAKPTAKPAPKAPPLLFVGSKKCGECHETQYQRYVKHSKKSRSYQSILKMEKGLTPEEKRGCYQCHSTGYGRPGGFVSLERTPLLKDIGCEACHGPGSRHVKSEESKDIRRKPGNKRCLACHVSARIKAFKHAPLTYGGAH